MKLVNTIIFSANRYLVSGLRLLKGLFLARILGPELMGVLAFVILIQMYLKIVIFGAALAINFELATNKMDSESEDKISDALAITLSFCGLIVLVAFLIDFFNYPLFEKFNFRSFLYPAILSAIAIILTEFFTNIYQVYGRLGRIGASELISVLPQFALFFIFDGDELIFYSLSTMVASGVVSILIFTINSPFPLRLGIGRKRMLGLTKLGVSLLLPTICFYLIPVVVSSTISMWYSVDNLGLFSFSNSLAMAATVGLTSIAWVYYPKLLSRTTTDVSRERTWQEVKRVAELYTPIVLMSILGIICVLPYILLWLPEYSQSLAIIPILLLSQFFQLASFAHSGMLYAKKQQRQIGYISFKTLIFASLLSVGVALMSLPVVFQAGALMLSLLLYSLLLFRCSAKILEVRVWSLVKGSLLNLPTFIPVGMVVYGVAYDLIAYISPMALALAILLNYGTIREILSFVSHRNSDSSV